MSVIVFLIWSITQVYRFTQKRVFSTIYISFCYTLIHFLFISYSFIKWLLFCYIAEFLPVPIFVCLFICLMAYLSIWLLPYVALLHYYGQFVLVFVHIFIQRSFGDKILKGQPMKFYLWTDEIIVLVQKQESFIRSKKLQIFRICRDLFIVQCL